MIKINYIEPNKNETKDDIAKYNIKICDKFKKADCLEMSCISWLKNDSTRDCQNLEELFRHLDLNSHVIAQKLQKISPEFKIGMPNDNLNNKDLEYVANISCMSKEDSIKLLLKHHVDYESNFKCLKKTGFLIKNVETKESNDKDEITKNKIVENIDDINDTKKILNCELKLDLKIFKPIESVELIIDNLTNKYGKKPEKIICGEIGINKIWGLMIDGQIVSPIGWFEKKTNDENMAIDYELIDFRNIKIEKC